MSKIIKTMIDPKDAVMLLIDHQSGLFQLVADMDMLALRNNVSALAKVAHLDTATIGEVGWRSVGLQPGISGSGSCKGAVPEAGAPVAVS